MLPFSPAVLAQVERLGGTWRHVPADADALTRVEALSFPKRLISNDEIDFLRPEESGLPDVDALIALDGLLPDVPVTDTLPDGVRWCGDEWQAGDITHQWEDGIGVNFPLVDLAADHPDALVGFRELLGDPQASRAVLLTYSDGYPNHHFINADDARPEDPAVWSTDHEGFFSVMEEVAPSLSGWLRRQLTDEEMYAQARASADG